MALSEFDLIERFFKRKTALNTTTRVGIGDDCALINIPPGYELAVTTDTMVENVHFFADVNPEQLGRKLLAVNLSDLAATGAKPISISLALTMPHVNEAWLNAFAQGLLGLAREFDIELIGGDTTKGPLTLTVQAFGLVPRGKALLRSKARVGDEIYLSGNIGDAGLGLKIIQGYLCDKPESAMACFNAPSPRVALGIELLNVANACIDVSDGLIGDLGHILEQSRVGACINWEALPLSAEVSAYIDLTGDWLMPLAAGDDYELCFTVSPEKAGLVPLGCRKIGVIEAELGLRLSKRGNIQQLQAKSYEHFSTESR